MRTDIKATSLCNWKNPTKIRAHKLKKEQNELSNLYQKEQTEYIQNKINTMRDSVENRQSRISWQTVNEVSRSKSTVRAKLTDAAEKNEYTSGNNISRIYLENFQNLRLKQSHKLLVIN